MSSSTGTVSQLVPLVFLTVRLVVLSLITTRDPGAPLSVSLPTLLALVLITGGETALNASWVVASQITGLLIAVSWSTDFVARKYNM